MPPKDTLIALLPEPADLERCRVEHWYRIPTHLKRPPKLLEGGLRWIALYQGAAFGPERYRIRYLAAVIAITQVARKELLPPPPEGTAGYAAWARKAEDRYYKIHLGPLTKLPDPVASTRGRRIVFMETHLEKLLAAKDLNDLFRTSAAEERLWEALRAEGIPAEREYHVGVREEHYFLDFAIFCRGGRIDVECDGGYHGEPVQQAEDGDRNNLLQSAGWAVLRFTPDDVLYHTGRTVGLVQETIERYGGLPD